MAVQLGKSLGLTVVAVAGPSNAAWAKEALGADEVVDYTKQVRGWDRYLRLDTVSTILDQALFGQVIANGSRHHASRSICASSTGQPCFVCTCCTARRTLLRCTGSSHSTSPSTACQVSLTHV